MKKKGKSTTPTIGRKKGHSTVVSNRKNTNASTRNTSRQRGGNNGSQQGSH